MTREEEEEEEKEEEEEGSGGEWGEWAKNVHTGKKDLNMVLNQRF